MYLLEELKINTKSYNQILNKNDETLIKSELKFEIFKNLNMFENILCDTNLIKSLAENYPKISKDLTDWFLILTDCCEIAKEIEGSTKFLLNWGYIQSVLKSLNDWIEYQTISITDIRKSSLFYKLDYLINVVFLITKTKDQNEFESDLDWFRNTEKENQMSEWILEEIIVITGNIVHDNPDSWLEIIETGIVNSIFEAISVSIKYFNI